MNTINKDKHFTGIAPACRPCAINQARSAARFAQLTEAQTKRIIAVTEAGIAESETEPILVQHIVRRVADAIIQELDESPDFDNYSAVKIQSNKLALVYANQFQQKINASPAPLETGLQIAAAGNIIDFGAKHDGVMDLDKELRTLETVSFAHYDIEPLKNTLENAQMLLYVCDNSGEIVFDMLFIKELQRAYPSLKIVAAVRDKPIINDATMDDAITVGLAKLVPTISSGSIYPGTILAETSAEFQELFANADLILAKGQGNFETMLPLGDDRVFFLLRIKCDYMAELARVEKDNLVLMRGSAINEGTA